jgi:hypothetical protein
MQKARNLALIVALAVITAGCAQRTTTTGDNTPFPGTTPTTTSTGPVQTGTTVSNEIPAGTNLVIRTDNEINAEAQNVSSTQSYSGEVVREVVNQNGQVLIPRNSRVNLGVFKTAENQVQLGVQSVEINGQTYQVNTEDQSRGQREGLGRNRRTAVMVGGGAVLGTLVGAIAGGAKGAVAGAAIGAAGGAATQVLTRGDKVNIPAESELTFRLDDPIFLQGPNTLGGN